MTGRHVRRCEAATGFQYVDVHEVLLRYKGEEVRFILTPIGTIEKLASMVESGQMAVEDVPTVPWIGVSKGHG
jgi:hypothetical protein